MDKLISGAYYTTKAFLIVDEIKKASNDAANAYDNLTIKNVAKAALSLLTAASDTCDLGFEGCGSIISSELQDLKQTFFLLRPFGQKKMWQEDFERFRKRALTAKKISLAADSSRVLLDDGSAIEKAVGIMVRFMKRIPAILSSTSDDSEGLVSSRGKAKAVTGHIIAYGADTIAKIITNIINFERQNRERENRQAGDARVEGERLRRQRINVARRRLGRRDGPKVNRGNLNYDPIPERHLNDPVLQQHEGIISKEAIRFPVSYTDPDGHVHTYERAYICHWLDTGHNTDPDTRDYIHIDNYYENIPIRRIIEARLAVLP